VCAHVCGGEGLMHIFWLSKMISKRKIPKHISIHSALSNLLSDYYFFNNGAISKYQFFTPAEMNNGSKCPKAKLWNPVLCQE
jgi:hypothetical protein